MLSSQLALKLTGSSELNDGNCRAPFIIWHKILLREALASVAQMVGALSRRPKGHRFDSWSGHIPRLQVCSPVKVHTKSNQKMFLTLISLSLSSENILGRGLNTYILTFPVAGGSFGWNAITMHQKVWVRLIPGQGPRLGYGFCPWLGGHHGRLSLSLSLFLSLPPVFSL